MVQIKGSKKNIIVSVVEKKYIINKRMQSIVLIAQKYQERIVWKD